MNKDKAIQVAKKLKALRDKGAGTHEGENAGRKLQDIIRKYGLDENDFLQELPRTFERTTLNEGSTLLKRIIESVAPDAKVTVTQDKTRLFIKCPLTDAEHMEVSRKYAFFWKAYNEERQLFLTAFLNKHHSHFMSEAELKRWKDEEERNNWEGNGGKPPAGNPDAQNPKSSIPNPKSGGTPMNQTEQYKVRGFMQFMKRLVYGKNERMLDADKNKSY